MFADLLTITDLSYKILYICKYEAIIKYYNAEQYVKQYSTTDHKKCDYNPAFKE